MHPENTAREHNFDGLVGPTHNYGGLSPGNLASTRHAGEVSNPRAAALQGLEKMRHVAALGVGQALLPPHPRPDLGALRRLGFSGDDAAVLAQAGRGDGHLLRLCSSASSMWTANAATVAPSADTRDGRLHLIPANLTAMFHRSLEAPVTARVLRAIFADATRFVVHDPLPGGAHFSDEGAANHTRLTGDAAVVHLLGWGRESWNAERTSTRYPARQAREASAAVARLADLSPSAVLLWQQSAAGIDLGAFHSDVLTVGHENLLLLHERAFVRTPDLLAELSRRLGPAFQHCLATEAELPASEAITAYPFNSQVVTLPDGCMAIIAPREAEESAPARRFLERVMAEDNPIAELHYIDVNGSMNNGGGPACLRLRVTLTDEERRAIPARVFLDDPLYGDLVTWIRRHYRDRLEADDLRDPRLLLESRTALDELTALLRLGSVYDFQKA